MATSKKITKKTTAASKYVATANDMSKVMGLDPAIDTTLPEETLKEAIVANAANIEEGDEFEQNTIDVINELECAPEGIDLLVAASADAGENTEEDTAEGEDGVLESEGTEEPVAPKGKKVAAKPAAPVKIKQPDSKTIPAHKAKKNDGETVSCYGSKRNTMRGEMDTLVSQNTPPDDIAQALVDNYNRDAVHAKNNVSSHLKFLAGKGIVTLTEEGYALVSKKVAVKPAAAVAPKAKK